MSLAAFGQSGGSLRRSLAACFNHCDPVTQCLLPRMSPRHMATETDLPELQTSASADVNDIIRSSPSTLPRRAAPIVPDVLTTIYDFPSFEPLRFANYPAKHLHMPLRRDILQRAIVFEGSNARQGTASTKYRTEVYGSNAKVRAQKGSGRARLGDKKSPMLTGGGVAFGPHPRDFGTALPRKIYDLAWRTALSYRYRRGELLIVQKINDRDVTGWRYVEKMMLWNRLGGPDGKSLIITRKSPGNLLAALNTGAGARAGKHGEAIADSDVDVKDLLRMGRIVIEKRALDQILADHCSDLAVSVPKATYE